LPQDLKRIWKLAIVCLLIAGSAMVAYRGADNLQRARTRLGVVISANQVILEANQRLSQKVKQLHGGGKALEQACRQEMNLIREDEIIYQ